MNPFHLTQGAQLRVLYFPGTDGGVLEIGSVVPGFARVTAITVQMENGQMSQVPWARVEVEDGRVRFFNLAHVEGVEFLDRLPTVQEVTRTEVVAGLDRYLEITDG